MRAMQPALTAAAQIQTASQFCYTCATCIGVQPCTVFVLQVAYILLLHGQRRNTTKLKFITERKLYYFEAYKKLLSDMLDEHY